MAHSNEQCLFRNNSEKILKSSKGCEKLSFSLFALTTMTIKMNFEEIESIFLQQKLFVVISDTKIMIYHILIVSNLIF